MWFVAFQQTGGGKQSKKISDVFICRIDKGVLRSANCSVENACDGGCVVLAAEPELTLTQQGPFAYNLEHVLVLIPISLGNTFCIHSLHSQNRRHADRRAFEREQHMR